MAKRADKKVQAKPAEAKPHLIGYARVSTADQDPEMQIKALVAAGVPVDDIYQETISGGSAKRPEFDAMMKDVREGDLVVVWKLDRLGRSNIGLHQTYEAIRSRGADLRILTQPGLDSTTAVGRAMFGMLALFAQFERDIGHERTMAGLANARKEGRTGGRRSAFTDSQVLAAAALGTKPGARKLGMSVTGFIRRLRKARENAGS